jgi:hypothetical protein
VLLTIDLEVDLEDFIGLLKLCYVLATSAGFSKGIFVAATNSTNQTNKADGACH